MKKEIKILISILIIVIIVAIVFFIFKKQDNNKQEESIQIISKGIEVLPTMQDVVLPDSAWCGTFQLVWNDMKNEIVKKDIIFNPQEEMAVNLNKEEFNENMISEEYYFKTYGLKTLELKEEIKNGIKQKFDQESDILEKFDWSQDALNNPDNPTVKRYFFYSMLYRNFEFLNEFDKLENGKFANKYNDVEYFGINENTKAAVKNQIDVLYYNTKDDFAILLNTKTDDQVIFCKGQNGSTFGEIYTNMINEANVYKGSKKLKEIDEFKAPNLKFDVEKEYTKLQNKQFETIDGIGEIEKAIQTIKFSLDQKGGEIKSEAGMDMIKTTAILPDENVSRQFNVDSKFTIFLREKSKDMPYFAGNVDNITKFQ